MTRKISPAAMRQRLGLARSMAMHAPLEPPLLVGGGKAQRQSRPRISPKTSGSQDPRYGTERWRQLSRKVRRERPRCEGECDGFYPSQYADHVIEVTDDTSDENFFSESNLAALCSRCHGRKTQREKARRAGLPTPKQGPINCGVDPETGLPRSPQHWWNQET